MKKLCALLVCFVLLLSLCSCKASDSVSQSLGTKEEISNEYSYLADQDIGTTTTEDSKNTSSNTSDLSNRKLIKDVSMDVETKTFDKFIEGLEGKVSSVGGYIESSDVSGNSYYHKGNRRANIVARIPADKLDSFINGISKDCVVTSKSESVTDVTLAYVDIESHIKALETEEATLLRLLEEAESMDDILAIQSRLSEVRYELERYESSLRTYDSLISYSTVTIYVNEVERETTVAEEEQSVWQEIAARFSDSIYSVTKGLRSFFVWFVGSLPHIILWAAIITGVIFGIKGIILARKKRKAKKSAKAILTNKN